MYNARIKIETTGVQPEIITQRNVYQVDVSEKNVRVAERPVTKCKKKWKWTNFLRTIVPSIDWLFLNYRWSEDFMEDTMAGITVAVLNIPQGMAYSILGNVEPTVGLYMAVFPVLIYALLGTSRHISLGVLSVVCLMTGKVVATYSTDTAVNPDGYSAIQVATAVTLLVGLIQLLMYMFRLGVLCTILSETLVSGFTAAVSIIVFTSQLKELMGISISGRRGLLMVPMTYYDVVMHFNTVNWVTTSVSLATITSLLFYNSYIKEKVNKRLCMPLPIELLVTILSTIIFQITTIAQDNKMVQMGEIKSGLPSFEVPPVKLFPLVLLDACIIAVVSYSITMSLALLVSEKLKYPLDTNQELLAQGVGNIVGAFFSCLPSGASPSRSASQQTVGGKTQMASIVSAGIIVIVLLWIGVLFKPLPRCILSSIVIVALKSIMMQIFDLPGIWKKSKSDGIIWIVTYVAVILVDIDSGLMVSVCISLLFVFIKGILNEVHVLGRLPNTDLYMRLDLYDNAVEVPNVKILRYSGSLNVINRYNFKRKCLKEIKSNGIAMPVAVTVIDSKNVTNTSNSRAPLVIVDMAGLQYADLAGAKVLTELIESLITDKFEIYLVAVPDISLKYIHNHHRLKSVRYFPTIHDAVVFHQWNRKSQDPSHDLNGTYSPKF